MDPPAQTSSDDGTSTTKETHELNTTSTSVLTNQFGDCLYPNIKPVLSFKIPGQKVQPNAFKEKFDSDIKNEHKPAANAVSPLDTNHDIKPITADKYKNLSPAEKIKHVESAVPYKEPTWGGIPTEKYHFEVLKNGAIIDEFDLNEKSYYVFGRLPSCDVSMDHPSLSRYHAVIQYCNQLVGDKGWYVYDLDSTHGTWLNKVKIPCNEYKRIRVGHQLKFGGSTRILILHGPESDRDTESQLSITEMREQKVKQAQVAKIVRQAEEQSTDDSQSESEPSYCSWGIPEDAVDNPDDEDPKLTGDAQVLSATAENEELYIDDPKKALKGYFEREGLDFPQYEFADGGFGKKKCTVELPIDDPNGRPIIAEVTGTGKKKELTVACALEACHILDKHGVLRAATHESHKKKRRNWEDDDFYSSDEDIFLDRTGTIEKKRVSRMQKEGKDVKADTYNDLVTKYHEIVAEIEKLEASLDQAKQDATRMENDADDALDAYMNSIKTGVMDASTKIKTHSQLLTLKKEEARMRNLVNLSKPTELPSIVSPTLKNRVSLPSKMSKIYGKVRKRQAEKSNKKRQIKVAKITQVQKSDDSDSSEEFDDDDESDEEEKKEDTLTASQQLIQNALKAAKTVDMKRTEDAIAGCNDEKKEKGHLEKLEQLSTNDEAKTHVDLQDESATVSDKTLTIKNKIFEENDAKDKKLNLKEPVLVSALEPSTRTTATETNNKRTTISPTYEANVKTQKKNHNKSEAICVKSNDKLNIYHADKTKESVLSKEKSMVNAKNYSLDPDYVDWLPPQGQSGDGKTSLNVKFGY